MYLYKSSNPQTFSVGRLQVSQHTGLQFSEPHELLEQYVASGELTVETDKEPKVEQAVQTEAETTEEVTE